ncbi:MAG TPA: PspA/IM30 family protein [Solimonas sp.]|nr:PspA/IM30 family protein [Solimonas sp.]
MGIFSRTRDVIDSNLNALLNKAEDPEKMARLIIQEMEDTLVEVRSTAVQILARKKELQRLAENCEAEAADWEAKAELALSKSREDLARGALGAKLRAQERATEARRELGALELELGKLDADIGKLRAKLVEARQRQKTIALRNQANGSRLKARQQMDDGRMAQTHGALERAERGADELEAQVEAHDLGTQSLRDEFAKLGSDGVEAELARLRAKSGRTDNKPQE